MMREQAEKVYKIICIKCINKYIKTKTIIKGQEKI